MFEHLSRSFFRLITVCYTLMSIQLRTYAYTSICIYVYTHSFSPFHKLYISTYICIHAIYLHKFGKKILYALSPFPFPPEKKTLELFQFNYTCIECVILYNYKSMSYLHEKIQFSLLFLLRYFFVCFLPDLIKL